MDTVTPASALGARLGFMSLEEEVRVEDAPVTGTIPDWLRGSLMRVSPGLLDIGGKPVGHWFDGMGMLNWDRGVRKGGHETDGFFSWHHVNSFEEGDDLIVDLVTGNPGRLTATGDHYQVGRLRAPQHKVRMCGELRRYRIPLEGGPVTWDRVSDADVEFPRINYARNTVDYQYCYCIAYGSPDSDWFDEVVKIDVKSGAKKTWSEDGCYPSEPLYAQAPGATAEDGGVLLNIVLNAKTGRSFMLILDAASMTELARVEAPHHIPFNFHQQYFPDKPHSVEAGA